MPRQPQTTRTHQATRMHRTHLLSQGILIMRSRRQLRFCSTNGTSISIYPKNQGFRLNSSPQSKQRRNISWSESYWMAKGRIHWRKTTVVGLCFTMLWEEAAKPWCANFLTPRNSRSRGRLTCAIYMEIRPFISHHPWGREQWPRNYLQLVPPRILWILPAIHRWQLLSRGNM